MEKPTTLVIVKTSPKIGFDWIAFIQHLLSNTLKLIMPKKYRILILVLCEVNRILKHLQNLLLKVVPIEKLKMWDSLDVDIEYLINLFVTKIYSIFL